MRFVSRAVLLAFPLATLGLAYPAAAQQDSVAQELEDLRNGIGLGKVQPPIDFAERPPLVVPPSYTLPPPGSGASLSLGVNDPDIAIRRKALIDPRRPVPADDPGAAAAGRMARTYLIDPPSGLRDPDAVLAGVTHDTGGTEAPRAKHVRAHKNKKVNAASAE